MIQCRRAPTPWSGSKWNTSRCSQYSNSVHSAYPATARPTVAATLYLREAPRCHQDDHRHEQQRRHRGVHAREEVQEARLEHRRGGSQHVRTPHHRLIAAVHRSHHPECITRVRGPAPGSSAGANRSSQAQPAGSAAAATGSGAGAATTAALAPGALMSGASGVPGFSLTIRKRTTSSAIRSERSSRSSSSGVAGVELQQVVLRGRFVGDRVGQRAVAPIVVAQQLPLRRDRLARLRRGSSCAPARPPRRRAAARDRMWVRAGSCERARMITGPMRRPTGGKTGGVELACEPAHARARSGPHAALTGTATCGRSRPKPSDTRLRRASPFRPVHARSAATSHATWPPPCLHPLRADVRQLLVDPVPGVARGDDLAPAPARGGGARRAPSSAPRRSSRRAPGCRTG